MCSILIWDFPGGSVVKNLPANAGDDGSIPGSGRSPGEGNGNLFQYSCLENSMNRGAYQAAIQFMALQSQDTTERLRNSVLTFSMLPHPIAPFIKIYIYKPKLGENCFHNICKILVIYMLLKELWTWNQPCFLTLSPHSVAENLFYTRLEDFRHSTKYCLWVAQP